MDTLSIYVALIFLEKTKNGVNTVCFSNALGIFQDGPSML